MSEYRQASTALWVCAVLGWMIGNRIGERLFVKPMTERRVELCAKQGAWLVGDTLCLRPDSSWSVKGK